MANLYISEKLKAARKAAGLTQRDVYRYLGVGQSTFSAWETGHSEPPIGIFIKLCYKYGIKNFYEYFLSDGEVKGPDQTVSASFMNKLLSLPADGRAAVENCLEFEYRTAKSKRIPLFKTRKIPFYEQVATAGKGSYLDEQYANLKEFEAPEGASFAIRISGDSMEPMIKDKDIVFVHQQRELASGEIGIFILDGESYCKMWDNRGGVSRLVSLNKSYKPIVLNPTNELIVCGKVIL